jgi:hypothetical protein
MDAEREIPSSRPRYRWPWFVLAGLILGILLAVLWMSVAVRQTRELRESNPMPTGSELSK